jgi:ethanolamine ammonia-lyase small subunit
VSHKQALATESTPALLAAVRARTPARLLVGRSGTAFHTTTQLELRRDHAFARDAVLAELDLARDLGRELIERFKLFEVATRVQSKAEFLLHPELGRRFSDEARAEVARRCQPNSDLQVVIGDGLSTSAVAAQVPRLLPLLADGAGECHWSFGQPFVVRHCRVGILNDIGELLDPTVVVLLIGERPGLATAESLSAYLAYRPRSGDTDAKRNLISNIHARGVSHHEAAARILALAGQMMRLHKSGVEVKEALGAPGRIADGQDPTCKLR